MQEPSVWKAGEESSKGHWLAELRRELKARNLPGEVAAGSKEQTQEAAGAGSKKSLLAD